MGFFDFIKQRIFGKFNKNRGLPKGKENIQYENNENVASSSNSCKIQQSNVEQKKFDNSIKLSYMPKPKTLDYALEQYILGILYQINQRGMFRSYRVLTELSSLDNSNPGNNARNEEILVNNILRSDKLNLRQQGNGKGMIAFNHVESKAPIKPYDTRIYINCKRENIAELADKFIKEFGDNPFYFKFCTDAQSAKRDRSERFVFYTSSEAGELNTVMQTIERTKQKNPKLFEGAENVNPFMKNFDGYMAYAPEVGDIFIGLDGKKKPISRSYNTLLSEALEDSFTHAIRDMFSKDYALSAKMGSQMPNVASAYAIGVLEDIASSPNRLKELIQGMKQNLVKESIKNPKLDINGINLQRENETEMSLV